MISMSRTLHQLCEFQHKNLEPKALLGLRANSYEFQRLLMTESREFTVGTACCGTDVVVGVLTTLMKHWTDTFGTSFGMVHRFSYEIEEWKREYIRSHFAPDYIFGNLLVVGGEGEGEQMDCRFPSACFKMHCFPINFVRSSIIC